MTYRKGFKNESEKKTRRQRKKFVYSLDEQKKKKKKKSVYKFPNMNYLQALAKGLCIDQYLTTSTSQ